MYVYARPIIARLRYEGAGLGVGNNREIAREREYLHAPEIRRRTCSFFTGLLTLDSRGRARLFEALITQQHLQKQLCTVLKAVASVFAGRVIRYSETLAACEKSLPRARARWSTPAAAVAIRIGFSRSRVPNGEKRILIARLNLNIASRDTL